MSDELLNLIAIQAVAYAREHDVAVPVAVAHVRARIARSKAEYQLLGAPYGDDDAGLLLWLTRQPATPAA